MQLVGSSGAGVGASALVVPVGSRRERLADMMRAIDQPTRGEAGGCFTKIGLGSWRRIEKGYFGNFTKYRLGDLWLNCGAVGPWRSSLGQVKDEDDSLRCVHELNPFVSGLNGCPMGIVF